MSKSRFYIGMIGASSVMGDAIASCPTDHKTVVQMRKDGLDCHIVDCGSIEIAIMYKDIDIDPITVSMAIDAFMHFADNGMPMYKVEIEIA